MRNKDAHTILSSAVKTSGTARPTRRLVGRAVPDINFYLPKKRHTLGLLGGYNLTIPSIALPFWREAMAANFDRRSFLAASTALGFLDALTSVSAYEARVSGVALCEPDVESIV